MAREFWPNAGYKAVSDYHKVAARAARAELQN
jgi:hypothetical protein